MHQQDVIVNGILNLGGKVLIAKRAMTKKIAPGKYHLPGGHVEFGEDPESAIAREFKEEFGLNVQAKSVVRTFSYVQDDTHTIGISFVLASPDDLQHITFDPSDNEQILWVDSSILTEYFEPSDHDLITLRQYFGL